VLRLCKSLRPTLPRLYRRMYLVLYRVAIEHVSVIAHCLRASNAASASVELLPWATVTCFTVPPLFTATFKTRDAVRHRGQNLASTRLLLAASPGVRHQENLCCAHGDRDSIVPAPDGAFLTSGPNLLVFGRCSFGRCVPEASQREGELLCLQFNVAWPFRGSDRILLRSAVPICPVRS
jgi:hypothetical protein